MKGLWVWNHNKPEDVINFCKKEGIDEIYSGKADKVLYDLCTENSIKISLLFGLADVNSKSLIKDIRRILNEVPFKYIHLDAEINKQSETEFCDELEKVIDYLTKNNLIIEIDVQCGRKGKYIDLLKKCDCLYLMAYRNKAIEAKKFAKLIYSKVDKPFFIGFETGKPSEKEEFISYYDSGRKKMKFQMFLLNILMIFNKRFKGIAIHHYDTFRELK